MYEDRTTTTSAELAIRVSLGQVFTTLQTMIIQTQSGFHQGSFLLLLVDVAIVVDITATNTIEIIVIIMISLATSGSHSRGSLFGHFASLF